MTQDLAAAFRRAAQFTRALDVVKATRIVQDALAGETMSGPSVVAPTITTPQPRQQRPTLHLVLPEGEVPQTSDRAASSTQPWGSASGIIPGIIPGIGSFQPSPRIRKPLGDVLKLLREGGLKTGTLGSLPGMSVEGLLRRQPPPMPEGAQFLTRSFTCAAGTRGYKLYIPASAPDRPHGLIVMLHGCKQDPDDFATGTNMNAVAEAQGLMVAYPAQTSSANVSSCWNWFNPPDQARDAGEPLIIAGITREIMSEFGLDRRQVFGAGLSAGGAMAAVMGETYPDLYAAVGIHSGLAYKSANDVISAFAAMRGEVGPRNSPATLRAMTDSERCVRTIVFHGSADQIVRPSNAGNVVDAASRHHAGTLSSEQRSSGGRTCKHSVIAGQDGAPAVECWLIDGAGHAWSGGRPEGSYTDPLGPDASAEMMRFFLA